MPKKLNRKKFTKVLQFLAAYLVASWTFLQFIDWILIRYSISPYWVDLLLWVFIGIIPSLIIYLYNQDRINNRILKLREKIIFPLNILLIMVVTYFGFGNSDLGATTKSIHYIDETTGEQKTALITKEEFRTGFGIYNFKPKQTDSTTAWMEFGITRLLHEDLLQNKNLKPFAQGFKNTTEKVNNAKLFYDSYIDGEFEIIDSTYIITAFIRNSENAKIISQETFKGNDFLNLIDNITVFVTNNFTSNEFKNPKYLDLSLKEFTSSSLKAIEHYIKGNYEDAIKEDNTFALAYLKSGKRNLFYSQSKFEERKLADKAYKYRDKLPLQKQGETLILKNLAYDHFENAEELIKLQLQVDPSDPTYNHLLYSIYGRTKNLKAYTDHANKSYKNNPNPVNGLYSLNASLFKEDYDKILQEISMLELLQPNNNEIFSLKLIPQLLKGDLKAAEKTQNKIKLIHPDWENLTKVYDNALAYLKTHKITKEALQKFEGEYRSNISEQTLTFWVANNTLLLYPSNQRVISQVLSGDNALISGHVITRSTGETTFLKNEDNTFYVLKSEQNGLKNSNSFWYWKIDNTIKKAESLLETKKLDSAKIAYTKAIEANPKHYFLKDVLAHINYVKSIDSLALQNQYKEVVGTYGPRKFWVEDSKLFYKRESRENGQVFPKIELLPIAKNRYINLTKFRDQFEFEYKDGKAISSNSYRYDQEKETWNMLDNEGNLFMKD